MKRLHLSPSDVVDAIAKHNFLFVGGPHKSGTTILWECLRQHSQISGFIGATDTDYSEGIFLQTVYPRFGIGDEFMRMRRRRARTSHAGGLGRYALNPNSHLTEASPRATPESRVRLFNEWGFYWNLSKPVLLEKSPPNIVISRFLQQLFGRSDSYFLFITRHPITNALSHRHTGCCPGMSVRELVTHWVRQHEILYQDLPHLQHSKVVHYEDFSRSPNAHMVALYQWLSLPPEALTMRISDRSIRKYERLYCALLARGREGETVDRHIEMTKDLGERVRRFGYDLDSFPCLQDLLKTHKTIDRE